MVPVGKTLFTSGSSKIGISKVATYIMKLADPC
jgi:hypothetical protein